MPNYGKIILGWWVLIILMFLSCAGPATPQEIQPPVEKKEAPSIVKEAWEEKWEKTLEAARKEGKVVAYAGTVADALKESVGLFKKKYGINLEILTGRGIEIRNKLLQERANGLFLADVFTTGPNTTIGDVKPTGALSPLEDALILPEVLDKNVWHRGELPWLDKDRTTFIFFLYPGASIAINTNLVKHEEIKSLYDLLDPRWKDKIIISDPTVSGPGFNDFSSLLYNKVVDLDYFHRLVSMQKTMTRETRLQIDWLAKGKYPVALWHRGVHIAEYRRAGAPVSEITAKEGTILNVDSGLVNLVNNAPHPNAAKILINWMLTREAQIIMQNNTGNQSARLDVPSEGLDAVRDPQQKYFLAVNAQEEWIVKEQARYLELVKQVFAPLLR